MNLKSFCAASDDGRARTAAAAAVLAACELPATAAEAASAASLDTVSAVAAAVVAPACVAAAAAMAAERAAALCVLRGEGGHTKIKPACLFRRHHSSFLYSPLPSLALLSPRTAGRRPVFRSGRAGGRRGDRGGICAGFDGLVAAFGVVGPRLSPAEKGEKGGNKRGERGRTFF